MDCPDSKMVATSAQPPIGHQESVLTPSTPSALPTEIYERIIDFLAYKTLPGRGSSPHDLALCCLTSRSWFPRCRLHLYFQIRLDSRARFETLMRCLKINPTNSTFVRKLVISAYQCPDQKWVEAVPLALSQKLKNLSILQLKHMRTTSFRPSFPQHLATFSTISELELSARSFSGLSLMEMILSFTRLQKLRISTSSHYHLSDDEETALTLVHQQGPLPLRHLSLSGNGALVLLPALVASATPLTTLHFTLDALLSAEAEEALRSLGSILSSCDTLHVFRLTVQRMDRCAIYSHLLHSSLSNLHHLHLHTDLKWVEDIAAVAVFLSTISARSLQLLHLRWNTSRGFRLLDTSAPWEVLNESLLLPNVCSTREISISIWVMGEGFISEEMLFRLLPALKGMNVVGRWSQQQFEEYCNKL